MRSKLTLTILAFVCLSNNANASSPTLGGPMSHLLITLFNNEIFVSFETQSLSSVELQDNSGEFVGASSVLNDQGYNGQFGWLANGFISLPPSAGIFVRTLGQSQHLSVYEEGSYNPILGTQGSSDVWRWDGTMTHNWYSTDVFGTHSAHYEVFVGDLLGNPLEGFIPGFVELNFNYGLDLSDRIGSINSSSSTTIQSVPAPSGLFAMLMCAGFGTHRKRAV